MASRAAAIAVAVLIGHFAVGEKGTAARDKPGPVAVRDVSALIEPVLEKHDLPGMAAAVVADGRIVAIGAAGVRRRGGPERVTTDDRFHVGSCTKAMTATLCAILVQEGKLTWDTTPEQVFPDLREGFRPEFRKVTLRQLLTHRSGTPKDLDRGGLWGRLRRFDGEPTEVRRLLVQRVLGQAPECEPGTKFVYSNAGYAIAGHVAETVAGKPWEDLMREKLFMPLGMKSADFEAPGTKDANDQPRGHTASGKPVEPGPDADNPPALGPAGTVHCSIADWARFVALHLGDVPGSPQLLRTETLATLHTPFQGEPPRYALGWMLVERDWAGGTALTHSGSNTLWFAVAWLAPAKHAAVLVACNQGGTEAEKACDEVASVLVRSFLVETGEVYDKRRPQPFPTSPNPPAGAGPCTTRACRR